MSVDFNFSSLHNSSLSAVHASKPMAEKIDSKSDGEVDRPAHLSDDSESGDVIDEKRLLRKIDARLLPAVGVLYLLSFLDRSNGMADLLAPTNGAD